MKNSVKRSFLLYALLMLLSIAASAQQKGYTLHIQVNERGSRDAVIMATLRLLPADIMAVTNVNGEATMQNVPEGEYMLQISYVGFETINARLKVEKDMHLKYVMQPTSLALKGITVTARQNASGSSTSSIIGRQAIDHLQATSLADIMQLVPGQLMGNQDLTSSSNLQLRQLVNNNTSAFGASIVVDGVPMSNNGALTQGGFSSTAFTGTDLRQIAADDIDEVEVVRGIPSAEYGDLTSGLVVVHSKVGVTPVQFKAKVNPTIMNYSLGKGENLGKAGILNVSLDYAQAWGDPRMKTRSFHRYTANVGWGYDITPKWNINTKLRYMQAKDWSGSDPDVEADGTSTENKNQTFSLTHNGRIQLNKLLARTLSYTVGISLTQTDNHTTSYAGSGLQPILTARESGYYIVPFETRSYLASGATESRPGNVYAKISDQFFFKAGKTRQTFKIGADYRYDWNSGRGYYNEDERHPLNPNSNGRPRAFSDVPGLHQIAAYAEDQFTWNLNKVNRLRATAGLRFTALQPFGDVATMALSPRLNLSFAVTKWLDIRGGIGMSSKTPGLNYLYPDKKYADLEAANYMPTNDLPAQILAYRTMVYEVAYSKNMKNATTTKIEAGLDFKLPHGRKLSLLAYRDKTPNGFGSVTDYLTYTSSYFTQTQGLKITPGQATEIDYSNPARTNVYFMTTGEIGNTNTTINRGIEADFDFGTVKPLRTQFLLSGAWQETKTWSTDMNSSSVPSGKLPSSYVTANQYDLRNNGLTPFKIIYPSGGDYNKYRRFVTTLRTVTHIPELRMVASFTAQAIWYDWNHSYIADKQPIAWIDAQLNRHELTSDMMGGYIAFDDNFTQAGGQLTNNAQYTATKPTTQSSVALEELLITEKDNEPNKTPVTWNLQARLTKELGKVGGLSFYVNNALYYEPFMTGNKTSTLTQRNTGFSFGAELYLNL
ncbi:MAG: TonB-dependent receptor plug domain-containing protein [Prevotella sp.]|nr:TonB-dependent receptor plug domain-containing protein [Prevotella sp.]